MSESNKNLTPREQLVDSVADKIGGDKPDFLGDELLPEEIVEAWPELPPEARAIAVLFGENLNEENNRWYELNDR